VNVEHTLSSVVPLVKILGSDGPTTVRNPGSLLKVDRIEPNALTEPEFGGAAERASTTVLQTFVEKTVNVAVIQILIGLFGLQATAFEENDGKIGVGEFERKR
jgi:hypothetical protein